VFLERVHCWRQYGFAQRWNHGCKDHTSNTAVGLEVAITNKDYCNGSKFPKSPTIIMIVIILHYHLLCLYPFGLYKSLVSLVTLVWDSSIGWMYHHKTFTKKFPWTSEVENHLLAPFDAASAKRDFVTMAESAKILSEVPKLDFTYTLTFIHISEHLHQYQYTVVPWQVRHMPVK